MTTYYVATRARYVLVNAADENAARRAGQAELEKQYADVRERLGRNVPIEIHTVQPATADEMALGQWHASMMAQEAR